MNKEDRAKELALEILDLCRGRNPAEILVALTLASAKVVSDVGREDASNAALTDAYAKTFRSVLEQLRDEPGGTLQ